jgi:hypothetical protein
MAKSMPMINTRINRALREVGTDTECSLSEWTALEDALRKAILARPSEKPQGDEKMFQTKSSKFQAAQTRAQRRNYQKNATRRTGVHGASGPVKASSAGKQKNKKTGMIGLRVCRMQVKLERSMQEAPGASFETHAEACGLGLATFYAWMARGEERPESVYGKFRQAMIQAMAVGEKKLHNLAIRTSAIQVLTRRFPNHYPSDRVRMDVKTDGMPISAEGNFTVLLELYPQQSGPQPTEKPFEIIEPNGSRWTWAPPTAGGNGGSPHPIG